MTTPARTARMISMPARRCTPGVDMNTFTTAMAKAATSVSVITTDGPHGRFGITVSAVSSVSAEPPLVLACVNRKSPAVAAMTANEAFTVNILAEHQRHIADVFAGRSSEHAPYDFTCASWHDTPGHAPLLTDCLANFECRLETFHDAGTHRVFIGRVMAAIAGSHRPLVYSHQDYRTIQDLKH